MLALAVIGYRRWVMGVVCTIKGRSNENLAISGLDSKIIARDTYTSVSQEPWAVAMPALAVVGDRDWVVGATRVIEGRPN